MQDLDVPGNNYFKTTIDIPKASPWVCYLLPHYVLRPTLGEHPNWFHRWMQRLCFGFKWKYQPL